MKINCKVHGSYKKVIDNLKRINYIDIDLDYFGKLGVEKLKENTPKDTSDTAESWSYSIEETTKGRTLSFNNSKVTKDGTPIVILLEYGHVTRGGTWFEGYDFIDPSINQVVTELIDKIEKYL